MNNELKPCMFCGENKQLQIIIVDTKNPGRDLVKCRHCRGEAPRKYWNNPFIFRNIPNNLVYSDEVNKAKVTPGLKPLFVALSETKFKINEIIDYLKKDSNG